MGDRTRRIGKDRPVALDMSVANVIAASEAGCNVLVTHHPPYIKTGPNEFGPESQAVTPGPGRMVYEAIERDVATIAMHTNADRAHCNTRALCGHHGLLVSGQLRNDP